MSRTGRYVKPASRASVPGVIFSVYIQPAYDNHAPGATIHTARFGRGYVTRHTRERGQWSHAREYVALEAGALLNWMRDNARNGRLNWVISPSAQQTLTYLDWWEYADAKGIVWERAGEGASGVGTLHSEGDRIVCRQAVVRGTLDILTFRDDGISWRWVSVGNYWPDGVPDGPREGDAGGANLGPAHIRRDGRDDTGLGRARAHSDALRSLCDWWPSVAKSAFGLTSGQLAWGVLRSHVPSKTMSTHSHEHAHRLERAGAHGGRACSWWVGSVGEGVGPAQTVTDADGETYTRWMPGPIHHVDVCSMYPSVMRDNVFPVKLRSYSRDVRPTDPADLAGLMGVMARVTIRTMTPEYPYRTKDRVTYPTGTFTTVLTGPELLKLQSEGEVLKCHELATYTLGRPFVGAVDALIQSRRRARSAGNALSESHAKLIVNSLAGKLAQRSGGWARRAELDTPGTWGERYEINAQTNVRRRYRYLAGLCWEYAEEREPSGPFTAAFAYVAAYGRLLIRTLRQACERSDVLTQDTDGLWLTEKGIQALRGSRHAQGVEPGQWRHTDTAHSARFWGPRHYCVDGRWTLSGHHRPHVESDGLIVRDSYTPSLWGARLGAAPDAVHTVSRTSRLTVKEVDGRLQPDGWVRPTHLLPRAS